MTQKLFVETKRHNYEPATLSAEETELSELLTNVDIELSLLQERRKTLLASCNHRTFYDVAGIPYDIRHCGVCDKVLERI